MKGNSAQNRVHYKGKSDDFIIFVDDPEELKQWRTDKTIPLAQVVDGWKVFVTHRHGAQGHLNSASHQSLDDEFGTHDEDTVFRKILEEGELQVTEVHALSHLPSHPEPAESARQVVFPAKT
ncbi:MAG: hypothetical protein M1815_000137 [Lichina confinis]|nr:MAG: hypothetical protein M1815_000137 [Lichina confinis]